MTTKGERAQLREQWLRNKKRFTHAMAEMRRLQKKGHLTAKRLEDLFGLPVTEGSPITPDLDFIIERVNKGPGQDTVRRAMIDLLVSDIPLSQDVRRQIAGVLRALSFPNPIRDRRDRRQMEAGTINFAKHILLGRGMTMAEAERETAKNWGMTVAALRKKVQRAKAKS